MMRIGHGHDTHRLEKGTCLRLGGIDIPAPFSAVGHSDADCLLHAVCDALLGALALGDLGAHFPDDDPTFKGMDSRRLLAEVMQHVKTRGYQIVNLDTTIHLERPKLQPFIMRMRQTLASILDVADDQISIKATTGEGLGMIGRQEAIVCDAVVLIRKELNTV